MSALLSNDTNIFGRTGEYFDSCGSIFSIRLPSFHQRAFSCYPSTGPLTIQGRALYKLGGFCPDTPSQNLSGKYPASKNFPKIVRIWYPTVAGPSFVWIQLYGPFSVKFCPNGLKTTYFRVATTSGLRNKLEKNCPL